RFPARALGQDVDANRGFRRGYPGPLANWGPIEPTCGRQRRRLERRMMRMTGWRELGPSRCAVPGRVRKGYRGLGIVPPEGGKAVTKVAGGRACCDRRVGGCLRVYCVFSMLVGG